MKLLYVAPFYDGTGYSRMAIDTVLSLDSVGVDVVCRNVKLANQIVLPPERIKFLEGKNIDNVTHNIQHILAGYFQYREGMTNIGYFHCETTHFRPSKWQYHCNLMDKILVSCNENKWACEKSGVKVPVKVIGNGLNPDNYLKEYKKLPINTDNRVVFYHIGDYSSRKNILNLVKCYFETFSKADNVVLVLKTYVEGNPPDKSLELITNDLNKLKHALRLYAVDNYPPVIVITDYLSTEDLFALHAQSDIFVSLERGAAWNLPAFDACGFGNFCIVNGWGGQNQFVVEDDNGVLLPYQMSNVYGMTNCPYFDIYTAHERWAEPDEQIFKMRLKECYEEINDYRQNKITRRDKFLKRWAYKQVGNSIKEAIVNV